MGGVFRCGLAGKARYVMFWSGAALRGEARQAWLVQDCCGASGRVKVRYGGAGMASRSGARWGKERHGTAGGSRYVAARLGKQRQVLVWQAWYVRAWHGLARRGLAGKAGMVRHGKVPHGTVCYGRLKKKGDIYGLQIQIGIAH